MIEVIQRHKKQYIIPNYIPKIPPKSGEDDRISQKTKGEMTVVIPCELPSEPLLSFAIHSIPHYPDGRQITRFA